MNQTIFIAAAERALATLKATHPARITINSKTVDGAAIESRGMMEDSRGSFVQGRKVRCVCAYDLLVDADVMDATTGVVKRQDVTVSAFGASQTYRVKRVTFDPLRVMWSIEAEQAVA